MILFAFCLGERGVTKSPVGEALADRTAKQVFGALAILDPKSRTAVVTEIEFREVAVQMRLANRMINARYSRLRIEKKFSLTLMPTKPPRHAYSLAL